MSHYHPTARQTSLAALTAFLWVLAFVALLLFGPRVTCGAEPTSAGLSRGAVRIRQSECDGRQCRPIGFWSGSAIARDGGRLWVLTCAHGYKMRLPPEVEQSPTVWTRGQFFAHDEHRDLAIIVVPDSSTVPTMPIAPTIPKRSDPLVSRAYPNAVEYREEPIEVIGEAGTGPGAYWQVSRRFIQGESGGSIVGPAGIVGVIQLTEYEADNQPDRVTPGGIVPHPTVREFVLAAFQPPQTGWKPFGQAKPKPTPPPPPIAPPTQQQPPPAPLPGQPPAATAALPKPPESAPLPGSAPDPPQATADPAKPIDWSLAQVVVCWPQQHSLDPFDWFLRGGQQLATDPNGPGQAIRRIINADTDGKADIRFVFERTQPKRYAAILDASGLTPGKWAGVVVTLKQQDSSLLDPVKNVAVRWGEKMLAEKLGKVPAEVILARTSPERAAAVAEALDIAEADASPTSWLVVAASWLFGLVYTWFKGKDPVTALWTR